jgi:hypothetical protein
MKHKKRRNLVSPFFMLEFQDLDFLFFDDRKIEGIEKLGREVTCFKFIVFQQGDMEGNGGFDAINYKLL